MTDRAAHVARADLGPAEIDQMRELLASHFDGVDEKTFARDLAEKSHVLRVWKNHRLIGFSTLSAYQDWIGGEQINLLYSGDTIMAPEGWGSPVLARAWIAMVKDVTSTLPPGRCFWLLLSAGFRTYRFLPVFWSEFWPRHDHPTPQEMRELMDTVAHRLFDARYDAKNGIVRFDLPHRLRGPLSEVPEWRLADPHVAFFLERNPGWRFGDELVCLAPIDDANLTPAGRRMVRSIGK